MIYKHRMLLLLLFLTSLTENGAYGRRLIVRRSIDENKEKISNGKISSEQEKIQMEKDELELKMKIETEIEEYHELKKKIQFLEGHLKDHADFNLIKTEDLVAAAQTLQELKRTIINPLEANLLAVKSQIKKENHNLNKDELEVVKALLDHADAFLHNSQERIAQLELIENEWDSAEESEKIRQAAESKLQEHKFSHFRPKSKEVVKEESPVLLRSKKLQKIKQMVFKKEQLESSSRVEKSSPKSNQINFREVKRKLDLEKHEDEEPGYAKKKIQEALREAAEKSHEFIDSSMHHGEHHNNVEKMPEEVVPPSWSLVFALAAICALLIVILMAMLYSRPPRSSQPWKRNLFKARGENQVGAYCELNDVKHDNGESALTSDNLSSIPWSPDNSWGDWDEHNSQKQK